jgi:hypothetical protein
MALPRPSPPPFDPKAKKGKKAREESRAAVPKTRAKVIKAPKEAEPAAVKLARVTAGPFFDERHPRTYEGWTVVVTAGSLVTYHRFREKAEAEEFAQTFGQCNP